MIHCKRPDGMNLPGNDALQVSDSMNLPGNDALQETSLHWAGTRITLGMPSAFDIISFNMTDMLPTMPVFFPDVPAQLPTMPVLFPDIPAQLPTMPVFFPDVPAKKCSCDIDVITLIILFVFIFRYWGLICGNKHLASPFGVASPLPNSID
jgi:hypothetical protein